LRRHIIRVRWYLARWFTWILASIHAQNHFALKILFLFLWDLTYSKVLDQLLQLLFFSVPPGFCVKHKHILIKGRRIYVKTLLFLTRVYRVNRLTNAMTFNIVFW
jgi:hypothetical protein